MMPRLSAALNRFRNAPRSLLNYFYHEEHEEHEGVSGALARFGFFMSFMPFMV